MNKTMLIVDDGVMNREMLKHQFQDEYNIVEAGNGEEALRILDEQREGIDIVLLDLVMPGISGMEVLEKRQQLEYMRKIPIVVITSSDNMEDQIAAFERGANDYVSKPFVPQVVATRVNNVLAYKQQLDIIEMEAQQLKMKSEKDEMTGLLNKATTEMMIQDILKKHGDALHVLMMIDIDNFKTVNDTLGHHEGDRVIQMIALILNSQFRKSDVIGRVGGDEFCVLMRDLPDKTIAYQKITELLQLMRYKPGISIPEYVTLSIGMAATEGCKCEYQDLFKKSDEALYLAKRAGKARYREYGVEQVLLEDDHRKAVIVLSANRSLCSICHGVIPAKLKIIEVPKVEDLEQITDIDEQNIEMVFVDVSEQSGDTTDLWHQIMNISWVAKNHVYAICQEGCHMQYMDALQNGAEDLFIMPIVMEQFKSRVDRIIERIGILE